MSKKDNDEVLTREELGEVAQLYDRMKEVGGVRMSADLNRSLTMKFETHIDGVLSLLDERVSNLAPEFSVAKRVEVLLAKHGAIDVCFRGLIEILSVQYGIESSGRAIEALCAAHAQLLQNVAEIACTMERDQIAENLNLRTQNERLRDEYDELMEAANALDEEAEERNDEMLALRKALVESHTARPAKSMSSSPLPLKSSQPEARQQLVLPPQHSSGKGWWTKKQLAEFILGLRQSKQHQDKHNDANRKRRQTLQEHLLVYLSQRYGLRTLVFDTALSIKRAAASHASTDVEACAFVKALDNTIDDAFLNVLQVLSTSIDSLLRFSSAAQRSVTKADWQRLINEFYDQSDAKRVETLLSRHAQKDGRLDLDQLRQLLLSFQLAKHERFLAPLLQLFVEYDADQDGIINREAFLSMLKNSSLGGDTTDHSLTLDEVDPFHSDEITFSAALLACEPHLLDAQMAKACKESAPPPPQKSTTASRDSPPKIPFANSSSRGGRRLKTSDDRNPFASSLVRNNGFAKNVNNGSGKKKYTGTMSQEHRKISITRTPRS